MLFRSLTGAIGGAALALFAVGPSALTEAVLGEEFEADRTTLLLLGAASAAMSLTVLFANISFAAGDRWVWAGPAVALTVELVLFAVNHESAREIAFGSLVPSVGLLAWSAGYAIVRRRLLFTTT